MSISLSLVIFGGFTDRQRPPKIDTYGSDKKKHHSSNNLIGITSDFSSHLATGEYGMTASPIYSHIAPQHLVATPPQFMSVSNGGHT